MYTTYLKNKPVTSSRLILTALLWLFGCVPVEPQDDVGESSGADPTPYLGAWQVMGNVSTTCSDGTSGMLTLVGPVSITRGTASDLLRTVTGGDCPSFPLKVTDSNAELAASVTCPVQPASQVTLTSWRITLGVDETTATETGSAKTAFLPPVTGSCTSIYSTSLLK